MYLIKSQVADTMVKKKISPYCGTLEGLIGVKEGFDTETLKTYDKRVLEAFSL